MKKGMSRSILALILVASGPAAASATQQCENPEDTCLEINYTGQTSLDDEQQRSIMSACLGMYIKPTVDPEETGIRGRRRLGWGCRGCNQGCSSNAQCTNCGTGCFCDTDGTCVGARRRLSEGDDPAAADFAEELDRALYGGGEEEERRALAQDAAKCFQKACNAVSSTRISHAYLGLC